MFADAESVERVLKEKPIYLNNNHRLNVEEKKRQGPGSFSDRDRQDMGKRGSQVCIFLFANATPPISQVDRPALCNILISSSRS